MGVNAQFYADFMRDFSTKLVPLLEDDIRVLIYAGAAHVHIYNFWPCDCRVAQGCCGILCSMRWDCTPACIYAVGACLHAHRYLCRWGVFTYL